MTPAAGPWILHVDIDAFLASVELQRHPELAGLPVIVGGNGDPSEPRKVVTCASYEARTFGVHAGMPLRRAARLCPDATFLPSDPAAYDAASEQVMGLLRDLGHPVEVWGWDEAYLGGDLVELREAVDLAGRIQELVTAQTGLTCSVGISDNKQRAKVATGFGKPAGIHALTDENWPATMGDRPVDALWGVGPKTAKKLATMGITTVAELAGTDAAILTSAFGPTTGLWILLLAKGGGDDTVSAQPWVPRSRSHVVTFAADLTDRADMGDAVTDLAHRTLAEVVEQHPPRHPRRGHRPHRHVLHPHQDPQARPAHHRPRPGSSPRLWSCSICSTWTGRCVCSACDWSWRCPPPHRPHSDRR